MGINILSLIIKSYLRFFEENKSTLTCSIIRLKKEQQKPGCMAPRASIIMIKNSKGIHHKLIIECEQLIIQYIKSHENTFLVTPPRK